MSSVLVHTTSTEQVRQQQAEAQRRRDHAAIVDRMLCARDDAVYREQITSRIGACTACGGIEVLLDSITGYRDLSHMGESAAYPTGYGCEVCS